MPRTSPYPVVGFHGKFQIRNLPGNGHRSGLAAFGEDVFRKGQLFFRHRQDHRRFVVPLSRGTGNGHAVVGLESRKSRARSLDGAFGKGDGPSFPHIPVFQRGQLLRLRVVAELVRKYQKVRPHAYKRLGGILHPPDDGIPVIQRGAVHTAQLVFSEKPVGAGQLFSKSPGSPRRKQRICVRRKVFPVKELPFPDHPVVIVSPKSRNHSPPAVVPGLYVRQFHPAFSFLSG